VSRLFGRRLQLTVSDGESSIDLSHLSVKFTVDRKFGSHLNEALVEIRNLSPETIGKINRRLRRIQLSAGYADGPRFGSIFRGEISNVLTRRDGPGYVTSLFAYDGDSDYRNTRVQISLPPGSTLGDVLRAIGESFPTLSIQRPERFNSIRLSGPQSYQGHARLVLDELFDGVSGYSWTVDDEKVVILAEAETDGSPAIEVNRDTGMVGNPEIGLETLEVASLLQPAAHPGGSVKVTAVGPDISIGATSLAVIPKLADRIPGLDGTEEMKIWRVTHDGETRGQAWYTQISALINTVGGGS
jgi:hypothetical protein